MKTSNGITDAASVSELHELYDDAARDVAVCSEAIALGITEINGESLALRVERSREVANRVGALIDAPVI